MAFGRLRRGFFASPAAIYQRQISIIHLGTHTEKTYSNNLGTNKRERRLFQYSYPAKEPTLRTADELELSERTRMFPVTKTNTVVVGTTTKVKDNTKDDKAGNSDDLDRARACTVS